MIRQSTPQSPEGEKPGKAPCTKAETLKPGDARLATEDELDKALADTFPASDPPASVIAGTVAGCEDEQK